MGVNFNSPHHSNAPGSDPEAGKATPHLIPPILRAVAGELERAALSGDQVWDILVLLRTQATALSHFSLTQES